MIRAFLLLASLSSTEPLIPPGTCAERAGAPAAGATTDQPVRTKITLTHEDGERARSLLDLFRDKRHTRTLEFDGVVQLDARGVSVHDVEIDGDLVPGRYALLVEGVTSSGRATRSGTLVVRESVASSRAR